MFLTGLFSWWYGEGFKARLGLLKDRLLSAADFFSIGMLLKTLFAPYKQISAGADGISISDKARALSDRLLSSVIGAIIRFFVIVIGVLVLFFHVMFGAVSIIVWSLMPVLPIACLIFMAVGWVYHG